MIVRRCAVALALALTTRAGAQSATAFVDVNVVPMDRQRVLMRRVVLVENGVITTIGARDSVVIPTNARRVDGRGSAYLIPGLVDSHVHLELGERRWLPVFLHSGVTTVFNLRGDARHLTLRDDVAAGRQIGPTIYTSGQYANLPNIASPEDAVREVQAQKSAGYDFVKIHGNLTGPTFRAMADEARRAGIALIGHAPRNLAFDSVIVNRQTMVAHVEEILYTHFRRAGDTSGVGALGARMKAAGVWLTPNLVAYDLIAKQIGRPSVIDSVLKFPEASIVDSAMRRFWTSGMYTNRPFADAPGYERNRNFLFNVTAALHAAGVRMLAGTDTPLPAIYPGKSLLDELDLMVSAGLTPFDALATATRNPGEYLAVFVGRGVKVGTVTTGSRADLVLVKGNPQENLSVLRRPIGVMVGGHWHAMN